MEFDLGPRRLKNGVGNRTGWDRRIKQKFIRVVFAFFSSSYLLVSIRFLRQCRPPPLAELALLCPCPPRRGLLLFRYSIDIPLPF
jgi:hypothetical protein